MTGDSGAGVCGGGASSADAKALWVGLQADGVRPIEAEGIRLKPNLRATQGEPRPVPAPEIARAGSPKAAGPARFSGGEER
ncbi:MAG: hypothetical protein AMXMBFR42_02680 [Burkholderiales bacterium]